MRGQGQQLPTDGGPAAVDWGWDQAWQPLGAGGRIPSLALDVSVAMETQLPSQATAAAAPQARKAAKG